MADSTPPTIDSLLKDFDAYEADYQGIAKTTGVLSEVEAAVGRFLETIWPKIEPFVDKGIDFLAIAAGTYAGPLAALVTYVGDAFGKVGLNYFVRWLAAKLEGPRAAARS